VVTTSLERRTIAVPVNEALVESFAFYDSTAEPDDRIAPYAWFSMDISVGEPPGTRAQNLALKSLLLR
jgi:hypothetical protein